MEACNSTRTSPSRGEAHRRAVQAVHERIEGPQPALAVVAEMHLGPGMPVREFSRM